MISSVPLDANATQLNYLRSTVPLNMIDAQLLQYHSAAGGYPSPVQQSKAVMGGRSQATTAVVGSAAAGGYDYPQVCYYPQPIFQPVSASPGPLDPNYLSMLPREMAAAAVAAAANAAAASGAGGASAPGYPPAMSAAAAMTGCPQPGFMPQMGHQLGSGLQPPVAASSRSTPSSLQKRRFSSADPFTPNNGQVAPAASAPPVYYGGGPRGGSEEAVEKVDESAATAQRTDDVSNAQKAFNRGGGGLQTAIYSQDPYAAYRDCCAVTATDPLLFNPAYQEMLAAAAACQQHQQQQRQQQQQQINYLTPADGTIRGSAAFAGDQLFQLPPTAAPYTHHPQENTLTGYWQGGMPTSQHQFMRPPILLPPDQAQFSMDPNAAAVAAAAASNSGFNSPARTRLFSAGLSRRPGSGGPQYSPSASILRRSAAGADELSDGGCCPGGGSLIYPAPLAYSQEQLTNVLAGLQLYGGSPGGGQTADRTYSSPRLTAATSQEAAAAAALAALSGQCPLAAWPNAGAGGIVYHQSSPYPSQTNSPFSHYGLPASQSSLAGSGGGGGSAMGTTSGKQFLTSQTNLEFDIDELARICPGINPPELDTSLFWHARYFVIKSNSPMHVMQSIRHGVWCSTPAGNDCLNKAFLSTHPQSFSGSNASSYNATSADVIGYEATAAAADGAGAADGGVVNVSCSNTGSAAANIPAPASGRVILFFSVNSSGCFCGVAEMTSPVNKLKHLNIWQDSRWRGAFDVRWIYAKNVPNRLLRHIQVESPENRAVTHLRDSNEILPASKAEEMLQIIHKYSPPRLFHHGAP